MCKSSLNCERVYLCEYLRLGKNKHQQNAEYAAEYSLHNIAENACHCACKAVT